MFLKKRAFFLLVIILFLFSFNLFALEVQHSNLFWINKDTLSGIESGLIYESNYSSPLIKGSSSWVRIASSREMQEKDNNDLLVTFIIRIDNKENGNNTFKRSLFCELLNNFVKNPPFCKVDIYLWNYPAIDFDFNDKSYESRIPGEPLFFARTLPEIILENKSDATIILDVSENSNILNIHAEASNSLSPFCVLDAVRKAALSSNISTKENSSEAFFVKSGLLYGQDELSYWFSKGINALLISSDENDSYDKITNNQLTLLVNKITDYFDNSNTSTNYFRYPTLLGIITIQDNKIVVYGLLVLCASFIAHLILNAIRKTKTALCFSVFKELGITLLMSFVSMISVKLISDLVAYLFFQDLENFSYSIVFPILSLLFGIMATLAVFFSLSALFSKINLLVKIDRTIVSKSAFLILWIDTALSLIYFPYISPLFIFALLLYVITSQKIVLSSVGLILAIASVLPFLTYKIFLPENNLGLSFISPSIELLVNLSFIFAPLLLWLVSSLSSKMKIHRGSRIKWLWFIGIFVFSILSAYFRNKVI